MAPVLPPLIDDSSVPAAMLMSVDALSCSRPPAASTLALMAMAPRLDVSDTPPPVVDVSAPMVSRPGVLMVMAPAWLVTACCTDSAAAVPCAVRLMAPEPASTRPCPGGTVRLPLVVVTEMPPVPDVAVCVASSTLSAPPVASCVMVMAPELPVLVR